MGTRNLTIVIDKQGALKVAQYGQWDGYPSGQGAVVLEFAKNQEKMDRLQNVLNDVQFYNNCEDVKKYIEDYEKKCPHWNDSENKMSDDRNESDIYWFEKTQTRDLCARILDSIITIDKTKLPPEHNNKIYLFNDIDFGKDSLFCEWAYCINFQTNKLECFQGFNEDKTKEHPRFATIQEDVDKQFDYTDSKYYGIKLIKEFELNNLPSLKKFIEELDKEQ